jgi:hypothetical protein
MRDGGEPPIRRVLRPDHHEEYHATRNLAEKRKGRKSVRSRGQTQGKEEERSKELWKNYRVSDSREEGE